jgi:hypothetical protein
MATCACKGHECICGHCVSVIHRRADGGFDDCKIWKASDDFNKERNIEVLVTLGLVCHDAQRGQAVSAPDDYKSVEERGSQRVPLFADSDQIAFGNKRFPQSGGPPLIICFHSKDISVRSLGVHVVYGARAREARWRRQWCCVENSLANFSRH